MSRRTPSLAPLAATREASGESAQYEPQAQMCSRDTVVSTICASHTCVLICACTRSWHFTACIGGGDLFLQSPVTCPAGLVCILSYKYKGKVLAGHDEDGTRGGTHDWFPYDEANLPTCADEWCTRRVQWPASANGRRPMFETHGGVACNSLLDDVTVSAFVLFEDFEGSDVTARVQYGSATSELGTSGCYSGSQW